MLKWAVNCNQCSAHSQTWHALKASPSSRPSLNMPQEIKILCRFDAPNSHQVWRSLTRSWLKSIPRGSVPRAFPHTPPECCGVRTLGQGHCFLGYYCCHCFNFARAGGCLRNSTKYVFVAEAWDVNCRRANVFLVANLLVWYKLRRNSWQTTQSAPTLRHISHRRI